MTKCCSGYDDLCFSTVDHLRWDLHQIFSLAVSEGHLRKKRDNFWRRSIQPKLAAVGLGWASFQVMRRTHSTWMNKLKVDPKLVADQLGHTLDVNQNADETLHLLAQLVVAEVRFGKKAGLGVEGKVLVEVVNEASAEALHSLAKALKVDAVNSATVDFGDLQASLLHARSVLPQEMRRNA
jgi:hypothetical protein